MSTQLLPLMMDSTQLQWLGP